jgi:hypothetical protein
MREASPDCRRPTPPAEIVYRPLKVYAFDPTRGQNLGNTMTVQVLDEGLRPGPASWRIAVIDYDPANNCYYEPVDLNRPDILLNGGLDPSESNPQFHQQMVYAVASETLRHFDFALGRRIRWGGPGHPPLRIFPHALQEANAYFDPELNALLFGYFRAGQSAGINLPGQTVFTCLSHDIVAHETTHAAVNALREHFMERTGPDALAFHEAFADIVALFQHFTMRDALRETVRNTAGLLYQPQLLHEVTPGSTGPLIQSELALENPLTALAQQFGEAMGRRSALRSALAVKPNSEMLDKVFEPHARGSILVAAVFDAFFTVYIRQARKLLRLAAPRESMAGPELGMELADALTRLASDIAAHVMHICIRAIDYCPPVDITFGEFLRAIITADTELSPVDEFGHRDSLIQAFRLRGIRPEGVISYSEDALLWQAPDSEPLVCDGLFFDVFTGWTSEEQMQKNAQILAQFGRDHAGLLHLDPEAEIVPARLRALHRIRPDGRLSFEVLAQLVQKRDVPLDEKSKTSPTFPFRGGVVLLFDRNNRLRFAIHKNVRDKDRMKRQREFLGESLTSIAEASYEENLTSYPPAGGEIKTEANFAAVHRGY